jgi:hypothetical protein
MNHPILSPFPIKALILFKSFIHIFPRFYYLDAYHFTFPPSHSPCPLLIYPFSTPTPKKSLKIIMNMRNKILFGSFQLSKFLRIFWILSL